MSDVLCATCNKSYRKLWATNQGEGCCSFVARGRNNITPGFGSKYCLKVFFWEPTKPGHVKLGNLCDICIRKRIEAKDLIQDV